MSICVSIPFCAVRSLCRNRTIRFLEPALHSSRRTISTALSIATATVSTRSISPATSIVSTELSPSGRQFEELGIDLLVRLSENSNQLISLLRVVPREECVRGSQFVSTTCASDTMDIVLAAVRIVVIDHVLYVVDI